jgi:hypothetical protein
MTANNLTWFEFAVTDGFLEATPAIFTDATVAFDATVMNRAIARGRFDFTPTNLIPVIPPSIVSPERFLTHLITWLRARGIQDFENPGTKLSLYDLIARNPFVRVSGTQDIELVLIGLREFGLDIEVYDEFGDNALFAAIREDNVDFVRALLNVGFDLNLVNNDAMMADEFALDFGNEEIMELIDSYLVDDDEIDADAEEEEKSAESSGDEKEVEQGDNEVKQGRDLLDQMDVVHDLDLSTARMLSGVSFGSL